MGVATAESFKWMLPIRRCIACRLFLPSAQVGKAREPLGTMETLYEIRLK
jgi:hypothetical protein